MAPWNEMHVEVPKARRFDVISAGEAHFRIGPSRDRDATGGAPQVGFGAGRGAVGTALSLARALHPHPGDPGPFRNARVGLATALDDDSFGRSLADRLAARNVDVGGVTFRRPERGVVFVEALGNADEIVPFRDEERPFTVPAAWSSTVLVLSGLTPVVSVAGSLCQAARAARRAGAIVVVAVEARPHVWQGRDARAIRMVLREADVIRYTAHDLDLLKMDALEMRASTRDEAVHVMSNTRGDALATGPFGEITRSARKGVYLDTHATGEDALTASICIELARAGEPGFDRRDVWGEALARGQSLTASM